MDHQQREKVSNLYLDMHPLLFEYARSAFSNDAQAEEAVQDTFIIAIEKADILCNSPNPRGWLVNALKYVISNTRRNQATAARIIADYLAVNQDDILMTTDSLKLDLLYGDLVETEEFQIVKEVALDGKSHLEIAAERNIRVDACRKRFQRAKEILRKKVKL